MLVELNASNSSLNRNCSAMMELRFRFLNPRLLGTSVDLSDWIIGLA